MTSWFNPDDMLCKVTMIRNNEQMINELLHDTFSKIDYIFRVFNEHDSSQLVEKYCFRFRDFRESFSQFEEFLEKFLVETEHYCTPPCGEK